MRDVDEYEIAPTVHMQGEHHNRTLKLGSFISVQRDKRKKGQLTDEQIEKLNKIGFVWDRHGALWQKKFDACKDYIAQYDKFPTESSIHNFRGEDVKLGTWIGEQRTNYRRNTMSNERIKRLEQIDFVWSPHDAQWLKSWRLAKQYIQTHGHCPNPTYKHVFSSGETFGLGAWCAKQRDKRQELSEYRRKKLDDIHFPWVE